MNANEMTFGVEIETVAPNSAVENDGLRIGAYHHGIQVPYLPEGWKAERDGSIDTRGGGHACEIVSPVLRGADGLAQVAQVVQTLEAKGHNVNITCGVHVHIGWSRELPAEALARLVTIVSYTEKGLYAITGTKSRERGTFCGGVRKYGNGKDAKPALDRNRYHALNLTNLANGNRDTVEFRVFSGSAQRHQGGRMDSGLPWTGRTSDQRQADADLEPQTPQGRMEEGRRRPERSRTPDGLPGLGRWVRPHSTDSNTDGSATRSRRTRSSPSSAAWPPSTTR